MDNQPDFKQEMTSGVKWVAISQGLGYGFQVIVWVILARLLPPASFGALSAAMAFSSLVSLFNELGMSSAIIQRKIIEKRHADTAFWIVITLGFIFMILAVLAASNVARFFGNTSIRLLVCVFAIKYFIDSFGLIPETLLKRALSFQKLALIDISANCTYGLVAITLALHNTGIISVAWGYLLASMLKTVLLWKQSSFRPSPGVEKKSFTELFHYGKNILGFKILNYVAGNIDIIVIGKLLGATALGYYSLALSLANFPRQKLSLIIYSVAFPVFSRMQDDHEQMRQNYLKIIRYAAVINFPLLIGLMLLASHFILAVYSSAWAPMSRTLQILCVYGLWYSLTTYVGNIYDATGHSEYSLKFCVLSLGGTVLSIYAGYRFGLNGIALALAIYAGIINIIGYLLVKKLIGMKMTDYFRALVPALASSGIMAAGLLLLLWAQVNWLKLQPPWFMSLAIIAGAGLYAGGLFLTNKKTFSEMAEIAKAVWQSRGMK